MNVDTGHALTDVHGVILGIIVEGQLHVKTSFAQFAKNVTFKGIDTRIVPVLAHDQQIPADPEALEPRRCLFLDSAWTTRDQHDEERGVKEFE